jgi:L-lactate dehydrogenase complex protein LldG
MSRENILKAVAANQPELLPLPDISSFTGTYNGVREKFTQILSNIGGRVFDVDSINDIPAIVSQHYHGRMICLVEGLEIGDNHLPDDAHELADTELALLTAQFAVAENGAVWLTEAQMGTRVLPFICQHLAVVVNAVDIVPTMHEAYKQIGAAPYGFGAFIAGPSKTADIEQSLVLGAHGARSMVVFIVG